jgi:hypothetical protein
MQTYVVRRSNIAASAAELDAALTRLRTFEEKPHALNARWIRSYAVREADGRFGLACVFQSDSAQTLARHAELIKAPAHEIIPRLHKILWALASDRYATRLAWCTESATRLSRPPRERGPRRPRS